jgi:aminoglycoside phosphotransferase (APT) family kinase protein
LSQVAGTTTIIGMAARPTITPPPPATGTRIAWPALPEAVRAWVATELGSPVVEAATQAGGFSPGVAARLVCADGRRAFVKAVGEPLNPHSPRLHRKEIRLAAVMPEDPALPRVLAAYDDGTWVALLLEDLQGRHPRLPWTPAELARVLDTLTGLAPLLDPSPLPADEVGDIRQELVEMESAWPELAATPPADLDPWTRRHLDRLAERAATPIASGTALLHVDLRADNMLLTTDGRVCLFDWAQARVGPGWIDPLLLMLEVEAHGGHDVDEIIATHPLTRDVDPGQVTQVVLAVSGMFQQACRAPAPPGLPKLRAYQRAYAEASTNWLRRRLGW